MVRLRIREVAEQHGIPDAAELSRRTGLSYDTAYRLWRGDIGETRRGGRSVGIMTLHRVAKALNVRIVDLFDEDWATRTATLAGHLTAVRA